MSKSVMETKAVADENQKSLCAIFRQTANLLSQFYSQSLVNQRLSFEAGESYAILEIHEWMLGKMREGKIITVPDIIGYMQVKMDSLAAANKQQQAQAANAESGQNSGVGTTMTTTPSLAPVLGQGCYHPTLSSLLEQGGYYPVMGTSSSVAPPPEQGGGYQESLFKPEDLFSPEELNTFLEMTGVGPSGPQEQDSYLEDAQMGGMN